VQGFNGKAEEALKKALEINPSDVEASDGIAYLKKYRSNAVRSRFSLIIVGIFSCALFLGLLYFGYKKLLSPHIESPLIKGFVITVFSLLALLIIYSLYSEWQEGGIEGVGSFLEDQGVELLN